MAQKKEISRSAKKSSKARAFVKDLTASKEKSAGIKGGLKKLPGKRTPPTVTLKRGMTRNIE